MNNKKRKLIDNEELNELKIINKNNFKLINDYKNKIKKIQKEIKLNERIIQDNCEHDYERIIEYGERTYYCCKICNYDTRCRIIY